MLLVLLFGCAKAPTPSTPVEAGRQDFLINCSSCHNINPNLDGSLGPAIAGSPRALVEARVLHQAYPPGYKPKRDTHLMRALPWLAPEIDNITAFLAAAKQNQNQK
ncbi:MAG TPA: cytochrome c [Candidatus Binataceae bacterium]|nr:cytochrome c [Candidatus Binataceae bacterium]